MSTDSKPAITNREHARLRAATLALEAEIGDVVPPYTTRNLIKIARVVLALADDAQRQWEVSRFGVSLVDLRMA